MIFAEGIGLGSEPSRVLVAWTDRVTNQGHVGSFPAEAPWLLGGPVLNVGPGATLRSADGRVFAVSNDDATVTVIDPKTWSILQTHSIGAGRKPMDIAVLSPELAYVSCTNETHLLRFDPISGTVTPVVDLTMFADSDGLPEPDMMAVHEGRLFVQVRRKSAFTFQFVPPAMMAVIDLATEQLIDADPVQPGVQGIELEGTAPRFKMQIDPATRRLFVSATGDFFDDGGIEVIDLDTLQTLGLIVREANHETGADLGAFVMVTPERGYLTYSTDFAVSSHLADFLVTGEVSTGEAFQTVGYFVPTLPVDLASEMFYFPDGGVTPAAVHVLDTKTRSPIASVVIGPLAIPTDVIVLPASGGPIPTASSWGMLIFFLSLACLSSVVLARRSKAYKYDRAKWNDNHWVRVESQNCRNGVGSHCA